MDIILIVTCICIKVLGVVSATPDPDSLLQNCSWTSYNKYSQQNEAFDCELLIEQKNKLAVQDCPNPIQLKSDNPNRFPGPAINVKVTFFTLITGESDRIQEETCMNVSFGLQDDSAEKVKGVQIQLYGNSYHTLYDFYCQIFKFNTELNRCAVLDDNCAEGVHRVFYYDRFCDIFPDSTYTLNILTLPFHTLDDRSLSRSSMEIKTEGIECTSSSKHKHCQFPKSYFWKPTVLLAKPGCDLGTVEVTFSLAPADYGIDQYLVSLYDKNLKASGPVLSKFIPCETSRNQWDQDFLCQNYTNVETIYACGVLMNITSLTFMVTDTSVEVFPAVKIDSPKYDYFGFKRSNNKSSAVKLEEPCQDSPCGPHGDCIYTRCIEYVCLCHDGYTKINGKCGDGSDIKDILVEQPAPPYSVRIEFDKVDPQYEVQEYLVAIYHVKNLTYPLFQQIILEDDPNATTRVSHTFHNLTALTPTEEYTTAVRIPESECPNCTYVYGLMKFTYYGEEDQVLLKREKCGLRWCLTTVQSLTKRNGTWFSYAFCRIVNPCLSHPCGRYSCRVLKKDKFKCDPCNKDEMLFGEKCQGKQFLVYGVATPLVFTMSFIMVFIWRRDSLRDFIKRWFSKREEFSCDGEEETSHISKHLEICVIYSSNFSELMADIAHDLCLQLSKIPGVTANSISCGKLEENQLGSKVDYVHTQVSNGNKVIFIADNFPGHGKVIGILEQFTKELQSDSNKRKVTLYSSKISILYLEYLGKPFLAGCSFLMMDLVRDFDFLVEFLLKNSDSAEFSDLQDVGNFYNLTNLTEKVDQLYCNFSNERLWADIPENLSQCPSIEPFNSVVTMVTLPPKRNARYSSSGYHSGKDEESTMSFFSLQV